VRTLLEEHVPHVYRFALRLTRDSHQAEEVTQETFARACRARHRLRDPEAARVWLLRIARNAWRDRVRRERRRPERADASLDEHQANTVLPDQAAIDKEEVRRALEAMDSLPGRQREVLYLHACEQLSLAQIAEVLQISPDAVKASLSLARKKMRRRLSDVCEDRFPRT
jgi:RNA polymerase sigma-70 factor (ECF subfamily)